MSSWLRESTISPVTTAPCEEAAITSNKRHNAPGIACRKQFMVPPGFGISTEDSLDDFPAHVGQAIMPALKKIGKFLVIEAKQAQQRGVEIMHMDFVLHGFI